MTTKLIGNLTNKLSTLATIIAKASTIVQKSNAVVLMLFYPKRGISKIGYRFHNRQSVSMQTSFVINPGNYRWRCLIKDGKVCTASVLQNANVHM